MALTPLDFARNLVSSDRPSDVILGIAIVTRGLTDDDPVTSRQGWPLTAETVQCAASYLGLDVLDSAAIADVIEACPRVSDAMLNRPASETESEARAAWGRSLTMHAINDPSVVWYGGMGHKLLTNDGGGVSCYRCGMTAEPDVAQELIPDCHGPEDGGDHHWTADGIGAECAYGDAVLRNDGPYPDPLEPCRRA